MKNGLQMEEALLNSYVDLQVNGYAGVDFNDPDTSRADLKRAAVAMQAGGVWAALPTVITGSIDSMSRCIGNLRELIESDLQAASVFKGIHIEGPFLSPQPGYIGAHPKQHALPQNLKAMETLCDAGGRFTRLVTLAPEVDPDALLTKFCTERGVLVAAGHTDATLEQLDCCIESGLSLFTHLGNGCPKMMDRHDNIIYRALSRIERLRFTLIADGFHIPEVLFRNLLRWIPPERLAIVSDAISAAGLGPGVYKLGGREVRIGDDRAARDPSGQHFVGSASSMRDADRWLTTVIGLSREQRQRLLLANPQAWLEC
jgi:N-acetylglucosamine-6-phosphate deacetylase